MPCPICEFKVDMESVVQMYYDVITILAVAFLRHRPTSWPPIFYSVFSPSSLHQIWGQNWQQVGRHTFLIMGGYPFQCLFGPPGLVFGAFLISGYIHVWAVYAMGRGTDYASLVFFALQPFGLGAERLWRQLTGRRVCGLAGGIWVLTWLITTAHVTDIRKFFISRFTQCLIQWCWKYAVESYRRYGFVAGIVIPPFFSPMRRLILPTIDRIFLQLSGDIGDAQSL